MSEYKIEAQQIYFHKWSIVASAIVLYSIYMCNKSLFKIAVGLFIPLILWRRTGPAQSLTWP